MTSLWVLTRANVKSFVRDRSALFWTLAFPLVFILLFGTIFSGGGSVNYKVGWVDLDGTPASAALNQAFAKVVAFTLEPGSQDAELARVRSGDIKGVIVVPKGYGQSVGTAQTGGAAGAASGSPPALIVYTDPSQSTTSGIIVGIVNGVVSAVNQGGRPPIVTVETQPIQTQPITAAAYFVPSILGMALMQLGLFGAIPLVQLREKHVLKRLNATPLKRWTLVGSNVLTRLGIAVVQTVLIIGVGFAALRRLDRRQRRWRSPSSSSWAP